MSPEELRAGYGDYLDASAHAGRYRRAAKPRDGRAGGDDRHDLGGVGELLAGDVRRQGRPRGATA